MDTAGTGILLIIILATGLAVMPAAAMVNPSAGYCLALGYEYTDITGPDGSMTGYCVLSGNRSVDAWRFLEGSAAPEMGYCRTQGLEVRTVRDPAVCGMLGSTCAACVGTDGTVREVTMMMGLDFREKICNETICCDPATDTVCPIGQEHGSTGQPGTAEAASPALVAVIAVVLVFIAAGSGRGLLRKKDGSKTGKNP